MHNSLIKRGGHMPEIIKVYRKPACGAFSREALYRQGPGPQECMHLWGEWFEKGTLRRWSLCRLPDEMTGTWMHADGRGVWY